VHISSLNLRERSASLKPTKSLGVLDKSEPLSLKYFSSGGGGAKLGGASRGGGGGTGASGGGGGRDMSTLCDVGGGGALTEGGDGALDIGGEGGAPTTGACGGGVCETSDCWLGALSGTHHGELTGGSIKGLKQRRVGSSIGAEKSKGLPIGGKAAVH